MAKEDAITRMIEEGKRVMPPFPSTRLVTEEDYTDGSIWTLEEKIDGANMGMALIEDEVLIRNRNHVLRKGYTADTPAKKQFIPAWEVAAKFKEQLKELNEKYNQPCAVYGEWCYAVHGVEYDKLPGYFIAFDIYLSTYKKFLHPSMCSMLFRDYGFEHSKVICEGLISEKYLTQMLQWHTSHYSSDNIGEGFYLKKSGNGGHGIFISDRAKFICPGYVQNSKWNNKSLVRQKLAK